jgi:hypothetical protein
MPTPPLLERLDIDDYRDYFRDKYCIEGVTTFDNIAVSFRRQDFDHCCFESSRRDGNKDIFSKVRAERLNWIEAALTDPSADLFLGWNAKKKRNDPSRRVAVIDTNYVAVIRLISPTTAAFVTAYLADSASTISRILKNPRWPRA